VGGIEGVAREKAALFRALGPEGVAIGNGDDARVRSEIQGSPARSRHLYGRAEAFAAVDVGAGAGRLVPRVLPGDLAVIDDTYNANPASTCASILAAAEIARATGRRLLLVLGEMRELGALAAEGHDQVGEAAARSGAARVFAVGGGASPNIALRAALGGVRAAHAERVEDAAGLLAQAVRPGDLVLVKGSRSIGTERVVAELARRAGVGQGSGT